MCGYSWTRGRSHPHQWSLQLSLAPIEQIARRSRRCSACRLDNIIRFPIWLLHLVQFGAATTDQLCARQKTHIEICGSNKNAYSIVRQRVYSFCWLLSLICSIHDVVRCMACTRILEYMCTWFRILNLIEFNRRHSLARQVATQHWPHSYIDLHTCNHSYHGKLIVCIYIYSSVFILPIGHSFVSFILHTPWTKISSGHAEL